MKWVRALLPQNKQWIGLAATAAADGEGTSIGKPLQAGGRDMPARAPDSLCRAAGGGHGALTQSA